MSALAVYAICLTVYALTCGASVGWLDAPELIAASSSLGVPHSPGHPLVVMLGKIASLLPIGDIPFRVAFASALAGAGAATAVFCLARGVLAPIIDGKTRQTASRSVEGIALGAALAAAFSWALWFQGVRAEVYALQAVLVVAALACALAYQRERRISHLLVFTFLAGLAAANHPAIAATVLVPAVVVVLWKTRTGARRLGLAAATGILGLVSLLYLPVRAAAGPAMNWGDPSSLSRFFWTITGRAFHKTAGAQHTSPFGQDVAQALAAVVRGATIPLALLALVAIYVALRAGRQRATVITLISIATLSIVGRAILGFDPETPDHHAYLIPAVVSVVLLGAIAIAMLIKFVERRRAPSALAAASAAIAMALLAIVQLGSNVGKSTLTDARASDRLLESMVAELPPRTLLLSAYFETRFQLYAATEVFGARPDVTILDRSFLTYPGAAAHQIALHPELATLINAPLRAGRPTPLALLDLELEKRPVFAELHPNVNRDLRVRLAPLGAFALYLKDVSAQMRAQIERLDAIATARLARTAATDVPFDGERAMLSYIWRDYMKLELYCDLGRLDAAAATYRRLIAIVPGDRQLQSVALRCRLIDSEAE